MSMSISSRFSHKDIKSVQSMLSREHIKLIFLITRCILLSTIALCTTVLFGCFAFYHTLGARISLLYGLWSFDMLMNCICLYLSFTFANKIYNKCCSLCHGGCQNMFEFGTATKMLMDYLDEKESVANLHT